MARNQIEKIAAFAITGKIAARACELLPFMQLNNFKRFVFQKLKWTPSVCIFGHLKLTILHLSLSKIHISLYHFWIMRKSNINCGKIAPSTEDLKIFLLRFWSNNRPPAKPYRAMFDVKLWIERKREREKGVGSNRIKPRSLRYFVWRDWSKALFE